MTPIVFGEAGKTLQWGHGSEAVEIWRELCDSYLKQVLQWGHGSEAVEITFRFREVCLARGRFNGATALRPWRCRARDDGRAEHRGASMGPRL